MKRNRNPNRNPRTSHRVDRLAELLREIVAEELTVIGDERLDLVTITEVRTDRDLTHARVWFVTPPDADSDLVAGALAEHRVRLQAAIGHQARLRRVPPLHFERDETFDSANRIEAILHGLDLPADDEPVAGDDSDAAGT